MHGSALVAGLALVLSASGCLPPDNRPTPGSVYVTTEASSANLEEVITTDGWHVSFERLLAGVGNLELEGDGCNSYSEARYSRLFDFTVPAEPQKVGITYGLGDCELELDMRTPSDDVPLGIGVTAEDVERMRLEQRDPWVDEPERTSVYVVGTAARDGTEKRFEWSFRDRYGIEKCAPGPNGELGSELDIGGEQALQLTVVLRGDELLRASDAEDAPLRFDELAAADEDGDGVITLLELDELTAPPPEVEVDDEPAPEDWTVADLIYERLVPRMARFAGGGRCEPEDDDRR
jgi:hypothetical protein